MLYALDLNESLYPTTTDTDASPRGALAELSEVYRQWGFDSGYAEATRDHLAMFVSNAEAVLSERQGTWAERDAARRLLYAFIARLERRMGHFRDGGLDIAAEVDRPLIDRTAATFDGGLGI